jgi:peptidoglycan/xylan/chitin deacetylase (PgdA/CDA1 family)
MAVRVPSVSAHRPTSSRVKLMTLIYHDVLADSGEDDSGFAGSDAASYKLLARDFHRHLDVIHGELGARTTCVVPDRAAMLRLADDALLLTFDDGGASGVDRIAGALEDRGWRGHFFVTSNYIGRPSFLGPADLRRLHVNGHVVGSHSASHPVRISHCPAAQIAAEWRDSCARISDILGVPVTAASVPGGFHSSQVGHLAAAAGVEILFTSEPRNVARPEDALQVIGRFSITRRTTDRHLRSLVRGDAAALLSQRLAWDTKKILKRVGGEAWLAVRRRLFDLSAR